MTRLYLAGGMTGLPDSNYPAFNAEAARLRALGYHVENPAEVGLPMGLPWLTYMRATLPMMLSCDRVAQLDGWEHSKGARIESHLAVDLGMPVSPCGIFTRRDPNPCRPAPDFSDMDDEPARTTDWAAA